MLVEAKGPRWLFDIPKTRALLVVAHSDDETIFAGGLILLSHETHWTVICCTSESNQRNLEFLCACEFLGKESNNKVDPVLLGLIPDNIDHSALNKELRSYVTGYDIVFTHNNQGEYGHEDHKVVQRCVTDSIANPNTWVFISPGSTNVNQEQLKSKKPGGNFLLHLPLNVVILKKTAFQKCHKSQAELYGYHNDKLRDTDLRETLLWEFESGKEEYAFYK